MSSWGVGVWFTQATIVLLELAGWPQVSLARTVLKPSHAIDLLPAGCEWSEKKKWSDPFLVLYFSWNLYMLYIMYIPLLLYGGKSAQQLSYGFNILDKLESCPHENQIPYGDICEKKWKWSVFGPLIFLKLIYIVDHVYTFIATGGNFAQQLSFGFNILKVLDGCPQEI